MYILQNDIDASNIQSYQHHRYTDFLNNKNVNCSVCKNKIVFNESYRVCSERVLHYKELYCKCRCDNPFWLPFFEVGNKFINSPELFSFVGRGPVDIHKSLIVKLPSDGLVFLKNVLFEKFHNDFEKYNRIYEYIINITVNLQISQVLRPEFGLKPLDFWENERYGLNHNISNINVSLKKV